MTIGALERGKLGVLESQRQWRNLLGLVGLGGLVEKAATAYSLPYSK